MTHPHPHCVTQYAPRAIIDSDMEYICVRAMILTYVLILENLCPNIRNHKISNGQSEDTDLYKI